MADNQTIDNNDLTDFSAGSKDVGGVQYQQVILTNDDATINADLTTVGSHDCQKMVLYDHSGNPVNSFSGTGGTSITDDAAFTVGTTGVTPIGGVFTTDTVDAGDAGALAMDASRRLLVSIEADNVGIGGGTQYTEDAAAAADPVGNALIMVRDDVLSAQTSTDGDNIAARGTNNGELYVKAVDSDALLTTIDADTSTIAGDTTSIDGKITACDTGAVVISSGTVTANLSATDNAVLDSIDAAVNGTLTVGSHAVTNAGTFAVQADAFPSTVHSADYDSGAGTDTTLAFGLAVPASGGAAVITGDATNGLDVDVTRVSGTVTVDGSGVTQPVSASSLPLPTGASTAANQSTGNSSLSSIDGKITACNTGAVTIAAHVPGTGATSLGKAEDAAHTTGDTGVMALSVRSDTAAATSGTTGDYQPLITDSTGRLWCNVSNTVTVGSHAVTNAGTFAVQASGSGADDGTTLNNPVMVGGSAVETDGTDPGSVSAENDAARVRTDRNRRMLVNTAHPNLWSATTNAATAQTNSVLKTAPGANLSLYITDIVISNGATAGSVRILENTTTPVIKVNETYVAINGGATMHFRTPIRCSANVNLAFTSTTVTTHTVTVSGYTAP